MDMQAPSGSALSREPSTDPHDISDPWLCVNKRTPGLAVTPSGMFQRCPGGRKSHQIRIPIRQGLEVKQLLLKEAKGGTFGETEGRRSSAPQAPAHLCLEPALDHSNGGLTPEQRG